MARAGGGWRVTAQLRGVHHVFQVIVRGPDGWWITVGSPDTTDQGRDARRALADRIVALLNAEEADDG